MNESEEVHIWSKCHACDTQPIRGRRFACDTCPAGPETELCEACYRLYEAGKVPHPKPDSFAAHADKNKGHHVFREFTGQKAQNFAGWLSVPRRAAPAPAVPGRAILRPEFRSGRDSFVGAYAFAAVWLGQPIILTALHVMDEMIKRHGIDSTSSNGSYTGGEIPERLTGVGLYDVFAGNWMLAELATALTMLRLPECRTGEDEPYSNLDVAAFTGISNGTVFPLKLAIAPPAIGEPVWLAARNGLGSKADPAVVVETTERTFVFRYDSPKTPPTPTSGAPLLNRNGEVVAVNVGQGFLEGHRLGHGNHITSIRYHLSTARQE